MGAELLHAFSTRHCFITYKCRTKELTTPALPYAKKMSPPKSAQKSRGFPKSIPIPFRTNAESCKTEAEAEAKAKAEDRVAKTFALSKAEEAVAEAPARPAAWETK